MKKKIVSTHHCHPSLRPDVIRLKLILAVLAVVADPLSIVEELPLMSLMSIGRHLEKRKEVTSINWQNDLKLKTG